VARLVGGQLALALEHAHGGPRMTVRQLACDSQPDDASAYHGQIAARWRGSVHASPRA
jgi:uncharacterized protein YodC (DUF2158 family)